MDKDFRIEQVHRYLSGEMDAPEREAFEEEMGKDEELKKATVQERQLLDALERSFDEAVKKDIAQVHRQLQGQGFFETGRPERRRQMAWRITAAAAVVAGLCACIWWLAVRPEPFDPELAYREHFRPETTTVTGIIEELTSIGFTPTMSRTDSLREALAAYRDGNYPVAAKALERFLQDHPQNDTARFYLALADLSLEAYERAAGPLSNLSRSDGFGLQRETQWYLALCYLQLEGRQDEARLLFEQLARDKTFRNRQEAEALTKALNEP